MILPIELIRFILNFIRDDYFLLLKYSVRLISLKPLHTIPKQSSPDNWGYNPYYVYISKIILPIVSTNKAYHLFCRGYKNKLVRNEGVRNMCCKCIFISPYPAKNCYTYF